MTVERRVSKYDSAAPCNRDSNFRIDCDNHKSVKSMLVLLN